MLPFSAAPGWAAWHRRLAAFARLLLLSTMGHASVAAADPPATAIIPTVLDMASAGTGCPIGAGGMVRQIVDGTPVFLFMGWGLTLDGADHEGTVSKFCTQTMKLGHVPAGYQLHIPHVTVTGWATLDAGTTIDVRVSTQFGDTETGDAQATVTAQDISNGTFSIDLTLNPATWSTCVNDTGLLPVIVMHTSVSLNGTVLSGGTYSSGRLGGNSTDMEHALGVHFFSNWRPCPGVSLPATSSTTAAPTTAPTAQPVPDPPIKDTPA